MPNRIIKESITTSFSLANLTAEEERHFYRLLVQADDYGCFQAHPAIIRAKGYALLLDTITTQESDSWTKALVRENIIHLYLSEGKLYGHFVTWENHQQQRAKRRKYPEPLCDSTCNQMLSDDNIGKHLQRLAPVIRIRIQSESESESNPNPTPLPLEEGGRGNQPTPQGNLLESVPPPQKDRITRKQLPQKEKNNWTCPDWFFPLTFLKGYVDRSYSKTCTIIEEACSQAQVDKAQVILAFCTSYSNPAIRLKYNWTDPGAVIRNPKPLGIAISQVLNGRNPAGGRSEARASIEQLAAWEASP